MEGGQFSGKSSRKNLVTSNLFRKEVLQWLARISHWWLTLCGALVLEQAATS
jgi:hypothetical protein